MSTPLFRAFFRGISKPEPFQSLSLSRNNEMKTRKCRGACQKALHPPHLQNFDDFPPKTEEPKGKEHINPVILTVSSRQKCRQHKPDPDRSPGISGEFSNFWAFGERQGAILRYVCDLVKFGYVLISVCAIIFET